MKSLFRSSLLIFSLVLFINSCSKDAPLPDEPVITKYTLSVSASDGGNVDPSSGTYNENSSVVITATPSAGFEFTEWTGDASGTDNPLTVTMTGNKTITATFSRIQYTLNVGVVGQGSVTKEVTDPDKTSEEYNSGTVVRLNATPDNGWVFNNWSGSSTATTNEIDVAIDGTKSVTATFEEQISNVLQNGVFLGVGKWKIRKNNPTGLTSGKNDECSVSEIIFRTDGTFSIITSTITVTGDYNVESNTVISLLLGSSSFGTVTNLILTDSFVSFTLELTTGCSGDNQGDRDEDYDETTDTITPREDRIIAEFEGNEALNLFSFNGAGISLDSNPDRLGINNSQSVARIDNSGDLYEGVIISPQITLDFSSLENQILKLDFYQETASEIVLLAKLEQFVGAEDNENLAQKDVEVEVTVNQSGWQTISFDFRENRRNSYPFTEEPLEDLNNFAFLSFFVGFGTSSPGTFYFDNIVGGIEGIEIPDSDGDTVYDLLDNCVEEPGDVDSYGCPKPVVYFENGKCKCPEAAIGDTIVIDGVTYTVVDNETIREEIANGNVNLCTSLVTDMSALFQNNISFNTDISFWDTARVTNMSYMFQSYPYSEGKHSFNQPLDNWNVSSVENFESMFYNSSFNQDIGNWDTSSSTSLRAMFEFTNFNYDIGNWETSNVTDMSFMFDNASIFNQDIGNWDTSNVTNMELMFSQATSFNQDIGNWDTSNVTDINYIFYSAAVFNQDLGNWDTSNVTNMEGVFYGASAFNKPLNNWDTSNVINMSSLFKDSAFNHNLNLWDTSKLISMDAMFENNPFFNQDIGGWNTSSVTNMSSTFSGVTAFNQNLTGWCVTNITSEPPYFADNSALTETNKPIWGTCPSN
ncbi:BspA family leucine-rich repeat surface protein [Flavobacteriaceae bacterium]|nr:BspA family leucine-rich repeat surface protein [Flavobacteriaceae bacterium]